MKRRLTILGRSLRLRCPACGQGRLFAGWLRMNAHCEHCQFKFEREPGYFLGSIYVNYGLTTIITGAWYVTAAFGHGVDPDRLIWPLAAFCLAFPLWFFRYARSLWLGMDYSFDPRP